MTAQGGLRLDPQLLSDLWIFRAAAQRRGITAAARHLNVTQGAVSQRVLRLESRLGVCLFERHKGRVTLTEAGAAVFEAMNAAVARLDGALAQIDLRERALVVSCSPSLASEWLMPRLEAFYRKCPGIELLIQAQIAAPSAAWMEAGRIDVMVDYLHASAPDLVELATVQEFTFPVCSPQAPEASGFAKNAREAVLLHDDSAWQEGEGAGAEWAEWLAGVAPSRRLAARGERRFNLAHLAYQAAAHGQGLALGRAVSVNRMMRRGDLVPVPDEPYLPSACYRVFSRAEAAPDSPVDRFARWLGEELALTRDETLASLREPATG